MTPIEQLRALLAGQTEALELLDKVALYELPELGDDDYALFESIVGPFAYEGHFERSPVTGNYTDSHTHNCHNGWLHAMRYRDKVAAVPGVVVPPIFGVGRDAENPRALIVSFSTIPTDDELRAVHERLRDNTHAATVIAPAESIPRARLDELLAAEKRVRELEAVLSAFVEYAEACNDDSPEFYRARAAIAASKEGLVAAPKMPTPEMLAAGSHCQDSSNIENYGAPAEPADIYAVMLAAAPQEPKP